MKGIQGSFLMTRDKRDIRPVLFKFGVVLVFSLGGILVSIFRARRIKPSKPSSPKAQDGGNNQAGHWEARTGLKNVEDHLLHKTFNSCCSASIQPAEEQSPRLSRSSIGNIGCNFSPRNISTDDKDAFLLPEFNDLVKEFDMSAIKATFSPRKDAENPIPNPGSGEKDDHELEIRILRNTVKTLKERERLLEIQLLEYRGIKEQETAVMELQNRLKINNMEAKLFNLKIETLQADKKRLEEQVAEYAKVVSELEAAKAKIKILKKKLRFEAEQNKGTILALQERVVKLQNHENHALLNSDNNHLKSQRIKELEEESIELRKYNHTLKEENSSLAQKLEYLQNLATSLLEDEQGEALKEENRILRQKNEDMTMDIERLQADRCTDIEELVYLRWINACLRYELRNYQPGSGKTIARDLSKTLSPKSEEKAKQLILEYAQKEGNGGDKGTIGTPDFDSDQWSSSQSNLTDSGDYDDSSVDLSSHSHSRLSRKSKVLGKLMNLLRGKHSHSHHRHRKDSSLDASPRFDVSVGRSSCDLNVKSGNSSQSSSRRSLDLPRYTYIQESRSSSKGDNVNQVDGFRRNSSDGSSSSVSRVIGTISEDSTDLPGEEQQPDHDQEDGQKSELVKYASVLRKIPSDGRLTSYCSF